MLFSECAIRYTDVFSHAIVNICFPVSVQSDLPMYSRTHYFIYTFQWVCIQIYRCILARNTLYMLSSGCAFRSIDVFSHAKLYIYFLVGVHSDLSMYSRTQYFIYAFQWVCNQIYRCILVRNTLYMLSSGCAFRYIDVFSHAILYIYFPVNVQSDISMYSRTQ